MPARLIIGDVLEVLRSLPDDSVDLCLTSPPFWNLRSYLPQDHPDKSRELGSEATPGAFLDALLDVVEEVRRVLAPHGSLCLELADSYFGSGGAGGDYAENGWRNGQPRFGQPGKSRPSRWSFADARWLAALIDAEGSIVINHDSTSGSYFPVLSIGMMHRSMCDRAAAITGVGTVVQKGSGVWNWAVKTQQARYVLQNVWHELMVKQPQALAAIEVARHVEDNRGEARNPDSEAYRETIRRFVMNLNDKGGNRGRYPSDWTPPLTHRINHELVGAIDETPLDKSLCMIPEGLRIALAYGANPWTGRRTPKWRIRNVLRWCRPNPPVGSLSDKFRPATSEMVVATMSRTRYFDLDAVREPHRRPPEGRGLQQPTARTDVALEAARKPDAHNGMGIVGAPSAGGFTNEGNPAGAPPLDWWAIPTEPYPGSHYATWPRDLLVRPIKAMCPERVCRVCGEPSRRVTGPSSILNSNRPQARRAMELAVRAGLTESHFAAIRAVGASANEVKRALVQHGGYTPQNKRLYDEAKDVLGSYLGEFAMGSSGLTLGWTDCGHDSWRPGVVLDPFAGSGTTLAVATGHGRDAIGVDLDSRNAALAEQRVGLFLTVEHFNGENVA